MVLMRLNDMLRVISHLLVLYQFPSCLLFEDLGLILVWLFECHSILSVSHDVTC